jgi:transposase
LRCKIQSRITSVKNRIRNILSRSNQDRKGLFTVEGRNWLKKIKLGETERFSLEILLEELDLYKTHLKKTEKAIRAYVQKAPHRVQEARQLVQTIPGVGEVTADVVISELGDLERFPSQKKVCSYAGLVPGHRQSAEREKNLPITKQGSKWMRWVLVEAAWSAVQWSRKWQHIYESFLERLRNKKKAIVAVARKLLCVMMALIRKGCAYSVAA